MLIIVASLVGWALLHPPRAGVPRPVELAHVFVGGLAGLALALSLVLVRLPLVWVLVLLAEALLVVLVTVRRCRVVLVAHRTQLAALAGWGGVIALVTVLTPIGKWDARSIWYFQAKIIHGEGLFPHALWTQVPEIAFAHVDYPKLLPALAALAATLAGYWNEYLPQLGMVVLWGVALTGLFALRPRMGLAETVLFLGGLYVLSMFGRASWAFGGYMDTPLAVYAFLALAYVGRFLRDDARVHLVAGVGALAVTAMLKNEGYLVVLCAAVVLGPALLRRLSHQLTPATVALALLFAAPVALWLAIRAWHGIAGDAFFTDVLGRVQSRGWADLAVIVRHLGRFSGTWGHQWLAAAVFAVAWLAVRRQGGPADRLHWLPVAFAVLYVGGLVAVYLLTPYELAQHVHWSFRRVLLTASGALLAATYLLIEPALARARGPRETLSTRLQGSARWETRRL